MERNTTGGRIETARKNAKLTQQQVANALHVKRETVNHWESNTRQIKSADLVGLSDLLGVSVDYLLCITEWPRIDETNDGDRMIIDTTGLTTESLATLKAFKRGNGNAITFINELLSRFPDILDISEKANRAAESALVARLHQEESTTELDNVLSHILALAGIPNTEIKNPDGTVNNVVREQANNGTISLPADEAVQWYLSRAISAAQELVEDALITTINAIIYRHNEASK